jgi:hypothetical protein
MLAGTIGRTGMFAALALGITVLYFRSLVGKW